MPTSARPSVGRGGHRPGRLPDQLLRRVGADAHIGPALCGERGTPPGRRSDQPPRQVGAGNRPADSHGGPASRRGACAAGAPLLIAKAGGKLPGASPLDPGAGGGKLELRGIFVPGRPPRPSAVWYRSRRCRAPGGPRRLRGKTCEHQHLRRCREAARSNRLGKSAAARPLPPSLREVPPKGAEGVLPQLPADLTKLPQSASLTAPSGREPGRRASAPVLQRRDAAGGRASRGRATTGRPYGRGRRRPL